MSSDALKPNEISYDSGDVQCNREMNNFVLSVTDRKSLALLSYYSRVVAG